MKIKKIEITGFKSFLDKTSVQFPSGICAIVGPNGCGKSNVVDALRWVMGEQSVKQLRGKSMEDIIFAGADGKPPLNMAEVSLTLDNDNGSAPEELKDYTEIMITRRLFRSGESAYFLNRQPCRLKDIHNIFLGSGMGSKSYSVIQQGNIGAITEAGPDERRIFIEEAAGVTRFKSRKNEAIRKVKATNQNLLRVQDIVLELQRQMAGLKRQAKKAELFKKYQAKIKDAEIVLAINSYNSLSGEIEKSAGLLQELKDTDLEHSSNLKSLDAAVEEIKLKRWQKNQEISAQKTVKFETQRKIDRMEAEIEHLGADVERLESEAGELESAKGIVAEKNRRIDDEIAAVADQKESLEVEIEKRKTELSDKNRVAEEVRQQLARMNSVLETDKSTLLELVAQEARHKNVYQNAISNKENLVRRLKRIDEEVVVAGQQVHQHEKNSVAVAEQLADLKKDLQATENNIAEMGSVLDAKSKELGQAVKEAQTVELERNTARSQLASLKKMEEGFEWYRDGVKAIMKRDPGSENGETEEFHRRYGDGIKGLTADILTPLVGYETAVEAILGEALQYVIVENQEIGRHAIDYLVSRGAGRSGFVPVSVIEQRSSGKVSLPANGHLLLDMVTVKPGYEKIAESILGNVVVGENLEEALDMWNQQPNVFTVVTRNGNVITREGMMTGGSSDRLSGILAKKQEIKDLGDQVERLNEKLEQSRQQQLTLENDVRQLEDKLQKAVEGRNDLNQEIIEAEKDVYRISEDLKHARRHLEIVTLEQEQLMGEESDIDDQMSKYNRLLVEIEGEVKAVQQSVAETSEKIRHISADMEEYSSQIVDLKVAFTALNAKMENSANTLRRLEDFKQDGIRRMEQLLNDITAKKQKKEDTIRKAAGNKQSLSRMYEDIDGYSKELERNESDYLSIDNNLKEQSDSITEIRNRRQRTLEKIRLVEVEFSQLKMRRDHVNSRIQERYHKNLSVFQSEYKHFDLDGESIEELEDELDLLKKKVQRIGDVNLGAIREYEQLKDRFDFLTAQRDDLEKAIVDLQKVIRKINRITQERFLKTFEEVNRKLGEIFPRLFEGGSAKLVLSEPDKPLETGVEYLVHPPGKKLTRMSLLSGGEKALSAIAFIFSMFLIKPASFCLMDEIDAPLDDANIFRFNNLVKVIGQKSQIIMITHNKRTMEFADILFGVTMEKKGISKVVSVNFDRSATVH